MATRFFAAKNWQWCNESIEPSDIHIGHLESTYRLDTDPNCSYGSCKCRVGANNASNPWCLTGLGEKRLVQSLVKESSNNSAFDRNSLFRKPDEYVGLTNLGATCYINAYLQVWYNNVYFRENILGIKFDRMRLLPPAQTDDFEFRVAPSECLATNLQLVFTLMKETVRKSINPEFFVKAIGLDASEQQDAQEFSQLFLTILQNTFSSPSLSGMSIMRCPIVCHPNQKPCNSNLINDLFQGECSYITECQKCKFQSVRHSNFIELSLNIQNSKDIYECMDELLKVELLEDENKYHCGRCDSKQNAKRYMRVNRLPPVLNLQLLRFVYDRKTGCKKKLSSKIKFFEELDLNSRMKTRDGQSGVYHLGAILMHVGKTAYSGHYTAQIRDFTTQEWNTFNDLVITKIKKNQQLGCTEDELESKASQDETPCSSKSSKSQSQSEKSSKTFSTANAYLLVYYRDDLLEKLGTCVSREASNQSEVIKEDNERLEQLVKTSEERASISSVIKFIDRSKRHVVYENLWINNTPNVEFNDLMRKFIEQKSQKNEKREYPIREKAACKNTPKTDYFFLPTEAIRKLLDLEDPSAKTADLSYPGFQLAPNPMTKYLCAHKCLNPLALNKLKVVSRHGLDEFKKQLGVEWETMGLALPCHDDKTTLCWLCVYACFDYVKLRETIKSEAKKVRGLLQYEYESESDDGGGGNIVVIQDVTTNKSVKLNRVGSVLEEDRKRDKKPQMEPWYWVGKESLRQWQALALRVQERRLPPVKFEQPDNPEIIEEDTDSASVSDPVVEINTNSLKYFNEDIVCPHGRLSTTQAKRLVNSSLIEFFSRYFSSDAGFLRTIDFTSRTPECRECLSMAAKEANQASALRTQREELASLYTNENRPVLDDHEITLTSNNTYYLVTSEFVREWRSMVRHARYKQVEIRNSKFMCEHGLLVLSSPNDAVILEGAEWFTLIERFKYDVEITVTRRDDSFEVDYNPELCQVCIARNRLDRMMFENKKIYVRMVEEEAAAAENDENHESPGSEANKRGKDFDVIIEDDEDTDEASNPPSVKRLRRMEMNEEEWQVQGSRSRAKKQTPAIEQKPPVKSKPSTPTSSQFADLGPRRSSRQKGRQKRDDVWVEASSNETIKDVKKKIASKTSKMISEQRLFFEGEELENDKSVLEYKIKPGDILILKIDKPAEIDDEAEAQAHLASHIPEIGFKGTNLLR